MSGQGIAQFIPLILIFVIFYFFLIRPQQKRVKDHKAMVESLKRGDEVITSGGIIGIVDRVMEDDRIEVTIGENTKVQIIRSTITSLLKKDLYYPIKSISTERIADPLINAEFIANSIAETLQARGSFRFAMKKAIKETELKRIRDLNL